MIQFESASADGFNVIATVEDGIVEGFSEISIPAILLAAAASAPAAQLSTDARTPFLMTCSSWW
jgi:hypothetical protein